MICIHPGGQSIE